VAVVLVRLLDWADHPHGLELLVPQLLVEQEALGITLADLVET
jgi:hypothetical protein